MLELNKTNGCMDYHGKNAMRENVCDAFEVTGIIRSLESNDASERFVIAVNDHNCEEYSFEAPSNIVATINGELTKALCQHRLIIPAHYEKDARHYITMQFQNLKAERKIEYRHSGLGWYNHKETKVFLTQENDINGIKSVSARRDFGFKSGSESAYKQFLNDKVYTNPTLSLGIALGYSAVVFSYLKDTYDFGEATIVNLCGASSTGKTTISQLLVSPFGNPEISNSCNTLVRTFHSTNNALYAAIDGIHGVPMVLDDITTNPQINTANLVYTLTSGEEKSRCNASGAVKDTGSGWSGLIAISSEVPIEDARTENQGLKARVIQTSGITWTPDAQTAEEIKSFVKKNYGHTGVDFAEHVASIDYSSLCDRFDKARTVVKSIMLNRDNLSDRLETKYTAIALTIELMNDCFNLTLDIPELMKILLAPEQNGVADRDISMKALEHIKDFIIEKRTNLSIRHCGYNNSYEDNANSGSNYGTIVFKEGRTEVYMPTSMVDYILKANHIDETATVKARWKANEITKCDTDRYDCKYLKRRCIHFIFRGDHIIKDFEACGKEEQNATQDSATPEKEIVVPVSKIHYDDDEAVKEIFGLGGADNE